MPDTVKQHYVPRFYLKNFCMPSTNKIYCYDKTNDRSFITRTEDIGHENLFYGIKDLVTDVFERAIARLEREFFVEPYYEFLSKRNFLKTSHGAKKWFFIFLAYQMFRTNQARLEIKGHYEGVAKELNKGPLGEPLKTQVEDMLKKIQDPNYVKAVHIRDFLLPDDLEHIFETGKLFYNKKWVIISNKLRLPLWCSDNPLSFYNDFTYEGNLGIMSSGVEIRFPLSNRLLLFSYDPTKNLPISNGKKMTEDEVKRANICQVISATRFIYSPKDDFNIARIFLEKNHKFRDPNRTRWKIVDHGRWIETIKLE